MDYNKPHHFMDTKSLNTKHVYLALKLSKYHFSTDDYQCKVNAAADALL